MYFTSYKEIYLHKSGQLNDLTDNILSLNKTAVNIYNFYKDQRIVISNVANDAPSYGIITSYNNTEGTHHIISIMNSGNNNHDNDNQNDNNLTAIIQLKTRIYYLNFTVLISFIYFIYSLYQNNNLIFERNRYEILYKNCTEKLDISNQVITIMSDNDSLSPLPVYFNNHLYNCFFPLYYINKCYLGIPGQH